MPKSFRQLIEDAEEYKSRLTEAPVDEEDDDFEEDDEDLDIDGEDGEEGEEETTEDDLPTGQGSYTADDLREIIDYVYEVLDKEDDGELNDSVGEIGLDLIYEYADTLPDTVINQIIDDLKEIFEIEDTMLESIVTEGYAFVKKKKGSAAKAAAKKARQYYKKNKGKLKMRAKKWRKSAAGKKVIALHKKIMKRLGKKKGARLVTAPSQTA